MSITVIHRRDVIRQMRDRWNKQYADDNYLCRWNGDVRAGEIRQRLNALDLETCSSADVTAVIGTSGWADLRCEECDADVPALIRIGEEPDYEARWRDVCIECLTEATIILNATKVKP